PEASSSTALSGTTSCRPTVAIRLSTTRTSPLSIIPSEESIVSTVALRNTTGRPEGKELLFTAAFWLMLLTSLSSGFRTRNRPYDTCWIQIVSYLLPRHSSRVVKPTFKRSLEEMNGVRITDVCPLKTYYTIEESVSRTSLRFGGLFTP